MSRNEDKVDDKVIFEASNVQLYRYHKMIWVNHSKGTLSLRLGLAGKQAGKGRVVWVKNFNNQTLLDAMIVNNLPIEKDAHNPMTYVLKAWSAAGSKNRTFFKIKFSTANVDDAKTFESLFRMFATVPKDFKYLIDDVKPTTTITEEGDEEEAEDGPNKENSNSNSNGNDFSSDTGVDKQCDDAVIKDTTRNNVVEETSNVATVSNDLESQFKQMTMRCMQAYEDDDDDSWDDALVNESQPLF